MKQIISKLKVQNYLMHLTVMQIIVSLYFQVIIHAMMAIPDSQPNLQLILVKPQLKINSFKIHYH